jgi:hypothetical protein
MRKAGVAMKDTPITPKVPDKLQVRRLAVFTSLAVAAKPKPA